MGAVAQLGERSIAIKTARLLPGRFCFADGFESFGTAILPSLLQTALCQRRNLTGRLRLGIAGTNWFSLWTPLFRRLFGEVMLRVLSWQRQIPSRFDF